MEKAARHFFESTSIHGLKYIAEKDRHWTERIAWQLLVALASYGMTSFILSSYHTYKNHAVSFVVDTAYLRWNTDFPAISVCEKQSDKIYDVAERLYGEGRELNLDMFLKDITFFDGSCYSCEAHCENGPLDCPTDLEYIVREARSSCAELIGSCSWNGEPLDCCEYFRPMRTELGPCYTFNSALREDSGKESEDEEAPKRKTPRRRFYSNSETGPGVLVFRIIEAAKIYLHSHFDVPFANHPILEKGDADWSSGLTMEFQIKEIENAVGVEDLHVWQRRCRFPWEKPDGSTSLSEQYSYSTCVVDCHAAAQLELCNCTDHFMPTPTGWNKTCTTNGLICLTKNQVVYTGTLRSLKTEWSQKPGLVCDCDTGCLEPEYTIVQNKAFRPLDPDADIPMVTIKMSALPTERFRRSVVRTGLDLVVSFGGTAGLFLGASLLSVMEILYHAFIILIRVIYRPSGKVKPLRTQKGQRRNLRPKILVSDTGFFM